MFPNQASWNPRNQRYGMSGGVELEMDHIYWLDRNHDSLRVQVRIGTGHVRCRWQVFLP